MNPTCDDCGKVLGWSNAPSEPGDRPAGMLILCPAACARAKAGRERPAIDWAVAAWQDEAARKGY